MNEMVERVAKGIGCQGSWGCAGEPAQCETCTIIARAAIEALREPTAAMRQAGGKAQQFEDLCYATNQSEDQLLDGFVEAYKSMIDEALR